MEHRSDDRQHAGPDQGRQQAQGPGLQRGDDLNFKKMGGGYHVCLTVAAARLIGLLVDLTQPEKATLLNPFKLARRLVC